MTHYYRESFDYPPMKLFLNSDGADVVTNRGNLTFLLKQVISIPNDVMGYVSLSELTIPNTNYNIESSNNTLHVTQGIDSAFVIPVGNYTVTTLLAELNAQMSIADYTVTYDDITCKFTFTNSVGDFTFNDTSTILNVLGFESATDYTSAAHALTSTKIIDLSGNNSFYFTTNLATSNFNFITSGTGRGGNVLSKLQLTTDGTGIEFYTNQQNFRCKFADKTIPYINITLLDEDGNPWVPSNKWSCVLDFYFYEKYQDSNVTKPLNVFQQQYQNK